ncbi:MAG: hypothetical protein EXS42_06745 [Lacunisphaera sp.]|nr:hypothetical protein [Lacunisphaera sp.]
MDNNAGDLEKLVVELELEEAILAFDGDGRRVQFDAGAGAGQVAQLTAPIHARGVAGGEGVALAIVPSQRGLALHREFRTDGVAFGAAFVAEAACFLEFQDAFEEEHM